MSKPLHQIKYGKLKFAVGKVKQQDIEANGLTKKQFMDQTTKKPVLRKQGGKPFTLADFEEVTT